MKRTLLLMASLLAPVLAQTAPDPLKDFGDNAWNMPGYAEVKALTPPPSTAEDINVGKGLAEVYCINCHGMNLDGEGYLEGNTLSPPPSLRYTRNYRYSATEWGIFRTIKYGIPFVMEPEEEPLTDDQIWALTAYVRSLQKE